jgi:hypothetical protein
MTSHTPIVDPRSYAAWDELHETLKIVRRECPRLSKMSRTSGARHGFKVALAVNGFDASGV